MASAPDRHRRPPAFGCRTGSLTDPYTDIDANVMGTLVMLELARRLKPAGGIVYASSSSVYGANTKQPFSVDDRVDQPVSLYNKFAKREGVALLERSQLLATQPVINPRRFAPQSKAHTAQSSGIRCGDTPPFASFWQP